MQGCEKYISQYSRACWRTFDRIIVFCRFQTILFGDGCAFEIAFFLVFATFVGRR